MKKKLITTLLIGATLGTGISALSTSSVNECRLTRYVTIAHNDYGPERVTMIAHGGHVYKKYPANDYYHTFIDDCTRLYCINDVTQQPQQGLYRNGCDAYYFNSKGQAMTGDRIIDGHKYHFNEINYVGHMVY